MSHLLPLRPYQAQALDALDEAWKTDGNRQAIVLPTGGGKTVIFAHLSDRHEKAHPGDRVLILVHTDELVQQAARQVRGNAPHLSVGIVKGSRNEVTADVIVASVQSLRSDKRRSMIRHVGLVIVDECHHATAATYRAILEHFGCFPSPCDSCNGTGAGDAYGKCWDCRGTGLYNGGTQVTLAAGFTATLMRGDGGPLGEVWQGVAFTRDIGYMVRKRYLVPPRGQAIVVPDLDLSNVRKTKADFREGDLGSAMVNSLAPSVVAAAYLEHAADRSGVMFCPTVASAEVMAEAMTEAGITCEVVHGGLDTETRRGILARLESGETQVVANCMVLTEGFDSPRVSAVVVARPTQSKGLYIQMVGRGLRVDPLRPYEDQDCLVLDVVGAYARHDLRSIADLSDKPIDPKRARSGRSLIDLEDEFDRGEGVEEEDASAQWYAGPVQAKDFDPLAAKSNRAWKKTKGGAYYLPAGTSAFVFLVPVGAGPYTVAWCTAENRPFTCPLREHDGDCLPRHGLRGALTEHAGLDLETALGWAEDLAVDMGADAAAMLTNKAAPWRRKRVSEYPKIMGRASRLGITFRPEDRAGEVSDRISRLEASARIDPVVRALTERATEVAA